MDRRLRKWAVFLLFMYVFYCFCGCSRHEPSSKKNVEEALDSKAVGNPLSEINFNIWEGVIYDKNDFTHVLTEGYETFHGNNKYVFEKSMHENDRKKCIQKQEELLAFIKAELRNVTIYFTHSYIDRADSEEKALFIHVDSIGTWKQILATIFVSEGSDRLYGYAYAKAMRIADSLGWEKDPDISEEQVTPNDIQNILEKDPGRIHLILPCFLEAYSTKEQIDAAKVLSIRLFKNLREENEESFRDAIKQYARDMTIPYTEMEVSFISGGKRFPLIMITPYTIEYIPSNYQYDPLYMNPKYLIEDLSWVSNMTEFIRLRQLVNDTMEKARQALAPDNYEKCHVEYFQHSGSESGGQYVLSENKIYVYGMREIPHEYIHYLHVPQISKYRGYTDNQWMIEGLACYYSLELPYDEHCLKMGRIGEPVWSFDEFKGIILFQLIQDYCRRGTPIRNQLSGGQMMLYNSGTAITSYLIDKYGEEEIMDVYLFRGMDDTEVGEKVEQYISEFELFIERVGIGEPNR